MLKSCSVKSKYDVKQRFFVILSRRCSVLQRFVQNWCRTHTNSLTMSLKILRRPKYRRISSMKIKKIKMYFSPFCVCVGGGGGRGCDFVFTFFVLWLLFFLLCEGWSCLISFSCPVLSQFPIFFFFQ